MPRSPSRSTQPVVDSVLLGAIVAGEDAGLDEAGEVEGAAKVGAPEGED
jgi:hypothetical protein